MVYDLIGPSLTLIKELFSLIAKPLNLALSNNASQYAKAPSNKA